MKCSDGRDHSSGSYSSGSGSSSGGGRRRKRVHEHVEVIDGGPFGGEEVIVHRVEES